MFFVRVFQMMRLLNRRFWAGLFQNLFTRFSISVFGAFISFLLTSIIPQANAFKLKEGHFAGCLCFVVY